MKSRLLLLLLIVAVAGTACTGSDAVVATVNGVDIHESDVTALRTTSGDTVSAANFRNDLSLLIFQQVMATSLQSQYGVEITENEVETALAERLTAAGQTAEQAVAALQEPGATTRMLTFNQYFELLIQAGEEALAAEPETVALYLSQEPAVVTTVCVRHILVETQDAAQNAFSRLEAGEDFATLATELSIDQATPGGDLGCSPAARYVQEFSEATMVAPIGEVFGPVLTQFGYHLLIVDERTTPTAEELAADVRRFISPDVLRSDLITWFNGLIHEADVSILSRVGEWYPEGPGIRPPE